MTGNIVPLDPDPHAAVQALLPWYATGRLDPAEAAIVEAHLPGCPACRAELAAERAWPHLLPVTGAQVDVEAGWAAMRARLAGQTGDDEASLPGAPHPAPWRSRPRGWASAGPLLRWGWAAPTAVAALLLAMPGWRPGAGEGVAPVATPATAPAAPPAWRALGAPAGETAMALVRFREGASEAQVREALHLADARVVDGPTATDAWVVALPREHYAQALGVLRSQPAVALAEALEGGAR